MTEKSSHEEQKKSIKLTKTHIAIITVLAVLVIFVTVFSCLSSSYDKIFSSISVVGTEVGKMTLEEAQAALEESFAEKSPKITINIADQSVEFAFTDFGEYDYETSAQNAYDFGRSNFITKFFTYITPFMDRDLKMEFYLDEEKITQLMENERSRLDTPYAETTYKIEEDKLIITSGAAGDAIDASEIIKQVREGISEGKDLTIDAKITHRDYDGIDIDKIYKEVAGKPEDAYYDEENGKIVPHKTGYDFDKSAAKQLVKNAAERAEFTIQLSITYPEVTEAVLSGKMFEDVIASYTTNYNPGEVDRTHNMRLAGEKVNGTVLAPGEVFSYNDVVGVRTVAKGYRNAKVFENGRVVDGLAGGICQVSTTIYNAALYSNMEIVERKNHSFPVSYAPKGQDATVVMGAIDFRFKNTMQNPVMLTCSINGGNCTVTIKGIKEKNYKIVIDNVITSTTPFKTEYENDETLEPGVEKVKQSGSNGYTVKSTRTVYENGVVVKTESLPSSYYIPLVKIISRNETAMEEETEADNKVENIPSESENVSPSETSPETTSDSNPEVQPEPAPEPEPEATAPELGLETEIYS